jgi:nucleotide-binding universal stress UspA family protein
MKILVAVDDSSFSQTALDALVRQFSPQYTEVLALHVVEPISISPPPQMDRNYAPELAAEMTEAERLVQRAAERLRDSGFKVETAVKKGDIRETIVDSAGEWGADLIMIGSHGHRGIRRFLLGSVAESVARHAPCSVEIVRFSPPQ